MTFAFEGAGFALRRPHLLARLARCLRTMEARSPARDTFTRLDDRTLRDIGVSRGEIARAIHRLDHALAPFPGR